jgi:hypothetical protein
MRERSRIFKTQVFWRRIERALALHQRGEVRSDGLRLTSAKTTLFVEWLARAIHPWDRDLPADKAERAFTQQCVDDTGAALSRLFAELPMLDSIQVRVRRHPSHPPLLSGIMQRDCLKDTHHTSIGMKLRAVG